MSKQKTNKYLDIPLNEQLDEYHRKTRYKLSLRLCGILTLIFFVLCFSLYEENQTHFFVMSSGVIICTAGFLYTYFSKKFLIVFWTLSLSGVGFTTFALFSIPEDIHYADFLWLFSSVLLAFFGVNKKLGLALVIVCFLTIAIFSYYFVNINLETVELRTTKQQIMLAVELIGSMGSGFYILYLFAQHHYFSVQLLTKINKELQYQYDTIDTKSSENETLIKEVHHRVKNNLQIVTSLLRMQSNDLIHDDSKKHFDEAIKRVMTMSLIHQKLYQNKDLSNINLKNYIESLAKELMTFVDQESMMINTTIEVNKVGMKTIVPLGLLINELVSNTIKYVIPQKGFAQVFINFSEENHGYILTYQDNGSWLEENDLSKNESTGFGSELIEILIEQMEGHFELDKGLGNSKYTFHIKNLDLE